MCTVLLPPGANPIAVKNISYHIISYIISYHIIYHIISHHITSHHIISYHQEISTYTYSHVKGTLWWLWNVTLSRTKTVQTAQSLYGAISTFRKGETNEFPQSLPSLCTAYHMYMAEQKFIQSKPN